MTSPFLTSGPTIINASGGRSSMLMVRRALDAHGGRLPADTHVVYCNTGRERAETLNFVREVAERWDVAIRWIERDPQEEVRARFREVTHATAARNGEPFASLIEAHRFLPNSLMRFCTRELKIWPSRDFMHARGYDHWTSVVGLRRDEAPRVLKLRARDEPLWDVACPLYDAGVTKTDVTAFWRTQPFGLALASWEGNCDLCFLKARGHRLRIMRDRPDLAAWWIDREAERKATFCKNEPSFAANLLATVRLPMLPMDLDPDAGEGGCTGGACTD